MNVYLKHLGIAAILAIGLAAAPTLAQHDSDGDHDNDMKSADAAAQVKCPVSGESANMSVSLATDEGPVFFCCTDCMAKFKADPAKYAKGAAAQRKELAKLSKVQVTCPVSHKPIDPDVSIESEGKTVEFCCKGCIGKYKADPEKYAAALANSYTYQTKCPVSGEQIDPAVSVTMASGKKIYFCCKQCIKKFEKNPGEFTANLAKQGIKLDAKDLK